MVSELLKYIIVLPLMLQVTCLAENQPESLVTVYALETAYLNRGECLIEDRVSGLVFCAKLPRRLCKSSFLILESAGIEALRSGIAALGIEHDECSEESLILHEWLGTLSSPVSPVLAKYGGSSGPHSMETINIKVIESCAAAGFTEYARPGFKELLPAEKAAALIEPALFLNRYTRNEKCRNSIPLTGEERNCIERIRNGELSDYLYCATGANETVPECNQETIKWR